MTPAAAPPRDPPTIPLIHLACVLGTILTYWIVFLVEGALLPWLIAAGVGMLLGFLFWNPYRAIGFVPPGLAVAFFTVLATFIWGWCPVSAGFVGAALGLTIGSFVNFRLGRMSVVAPFWHAISLTACATVAILPLLPGVDRGEVVDWYPLAAALVLGPAALLAWLRLFRPAFSLLVEATLIVMYKIRHVGPGMAALPRHGPCIMLANHACWFDPLFLEKMLTRRTVPMMTAKFYDLPFVSRVMKIFGVIRVPEHKLKQATPEIDQAIEALDRGECVVIFPEGYLRRSEEHVLRRFGRGIHRILAARPNTPVIACWVDGAWGSYTSYKDGLPTKNKKKDFRRPIRIAVPLAITIPPEVLANHLQTRVFLMNEVIAARKLLGLPELPRFELPEKDEESE